jgi:hypothetical protein
MVFWGRSCRCKQNQGLSKQDEPSVGAGPPSETHDNASLTLDKEWQDVQTRLE